MSNETRDLADQDPATIQAEIDTTRSAITSKLEALEDQVVGTMQSARESVEETIETVRGTVEDTVNTVKETMQDTVSTVKETFDIPLQVRRHPWAMVGGSWVAGLVLGAVVGESRHRRRMPMDRLASHGEPMSERAPRNTTSAREFFDTGSRAEPPREPGLFDRFHGEIEQVKGLAIGMALGLVRDVIKENLPQLEQQVGEIVDGITTKLGGTPVQGRVMEYNPFAK